MIDHVDAFDLDCDDAPTTSAIFMARLSPIGSVTRDDVGPFYDIGILSEKESSEREDKYIDEVLVLNKKKKELENIAYEIGQIIQTTHMLTKPHALYHNASKTALRYQNPLYLKQAQRKQHVLYDGKNLADKHDPIFMFDYEETLTLAEESRLKMKEKQAEHDDKPIDYSKINMLYEYFVPQKQMSTEQAYSLPVSEMSVVKVKPQTLKIKIIVVGDMDAVALVKKLVKVVGIFDIESVGMMAPPNPQPVPEKKNLKKTKKKKKKKKKYNKGKEKENRQEEKEEEIDDEEYWTD
nr:hypothetical protein [Tanacetum cinerariifolium]